MNTQDFERLKKLCQENDFEIDGVMNDEGVYFIRKKDPWDGVEFYQDHLGIVRKMTDDVLKVIKGGVKLLLHPSTEPQYVDQLKNEAFERFGEIKEGDGVDIGGHRHTVIKGNWIGYEYDKSTDRLFYVISPSIETYLKDTSRVVLYQSGKWANRVKERTKVSLILEHKYCDSLMFKFDTGFVNETKGIGEFLAKQLEEYLNKE